MLGFGGNRSLINHMASQLRIANDQFDVAIATTGVLRRVDPPELGEKYLTVILGFSEQIRRMNKATDTEASKALKEFLSDQPDGRVVQRRIEAIAAADVHLLFRMQAGSALASSERSPGSPEHMMKLAALLFDN